ncbi:hypothetical protein BN8_05192 [Fibrisoma limi BUZ 3]|uniref:Secretion system C-terminal sorting domain-containing protein n=1 Tax=Fibrisoma limi BUZ 3 TaxID=1185876 RepID=I2GPR6_9BACT|nr:T9SS type A sorting domain-containing protein [Fibrisoma limi]CCH55894.1 hypothetical protein BN8_05192 [Fibrisoma limi BUZ 3]
MKKLLLVVLTVFCQTLWGQTIQNVKVVGATTSPAEVPPGATFLVSFDAKNFKCPETKFKIDFIQTGSLAVVSSSTITASPASLVMPSNAPQNKLYQIKVSSVRPAECRVDPLATGNLLTVRAVGPATPPTLPDSIEASPGVVTVLGVDETKFNPAEVQVTLNLTGAQFSNDPTDLSTYINGDFVPTKNLSITPNSISFGLSLKEGFNNFFFHTVDKQGLGIEGTYKLWSGSQSLVVNAINQANNPVNDASVKVVLSDDEIVVAEGKTVNGSVVFPNIPNRTLIVTASTSDNLFGVAGTVGGAGVTVRLTPIKTPNPINNNDFSLGTQGWDIGTAPVTIIPHQEANAQQFSITASNQDMKVSTAGEGPQNVSRTFITKKGTKNVTVRYQFITSEVPGGYFGSQYNDYYSIAIRSEKGKANQSEQKTMNGLGLGAFEYSSGATAFRELSLPVSVEGDVVHIDAEVANVADGLYDSYIVIDFVEERQVTITKKKLIDPDRTHTLSHLSIDNHSYFEGFVPVYGQITVEGPAEDKITSLQLQVYQGQTLINSANLHETAQSILFQTFGEDEKVEITTNRLLFNLPSRAPLNADGQVLLKLRVETEKSTQAVSVDYGSFANMMLARNLPRYSTDDDANEGGDMWGLPSMITYVSSLPANWSYNDISNMNGNVFPPHGSHRDGLDIDGYFAGYNARNAAVAQQFIDFLKTPAGSDAQAIFVAFEKTPTDTFWQTIKDATVNGSPVTNIIQRDMGHTTHFHLRKRPAAQANLVALNKKVRARQAARQQESSQVVNIYPNPASLSQSSINIKVNAIPNAIVEAEVLNLFGYSLKKLSGRSTSGEVNLMLNVDNRSIAPGMYLIKIHVPGKPVETKRLVVTD